MLQLKELLIDTKSAWLDYPEHKGFEVQVAMVSRPETTRLRKSCITSKFDRKTQQPIENLDEDKFVDIFTKATLKGWKGLTLEHLKSLVLVNIGDVDPSTELEYSEENALMLVQASTEFDTWLNEVVFDLENFRN